MFDNRSAGTRSHRKRIEYIILLSWFFPVLGLRMAIPIGH
jgi:hypothetical protein